MNSKNIFGIVTYLNENKEKYSKDALIAELKKAGYAEGDIAEGIAQVFDGVAPKLTAAKTSFWNFKDKKVYTSAGQKWEDFSFGVFAPASLGFIITNNLGFIGYVTPIVVPLGFLFLVVGTVHLFSHRRFMFYGMMSSMVILPLFFILFLAALFSF